MKFRKVVASIIATAVIITSSSFTNVAYAAEIKDEVPVATEMAAQTPAQIESVTDNEPAVVQEPASEDKPAVEDKPTTDQQPAGEEKPVSEEEDTDHPATEELPTDEEIEAEKPSDAVTDLANTGETVDETVVETEVLEEEGDELLKSNDYFEVDGDGKLKRKTDAGGKVIPLQEDVRIPANCKTIPADIFRNNRIVKTIRFDRSYDNDGKSYKDQTGANNKQLLESIADKAFENSAIEQIIGLPSGVTAIPVDCFIGSNLKRITFETDSNHTESSSQQYYSKTITSIRSNAFKGVRFDNTTLEFYGCTTIEASAFEESNITEIRLQDKGGANITTIGNSAFKNCSNLQIFGNSGSKWPVTISSIGSGAFEGTALSYVDLSGVSLEPNGGLNSETFKNCKKLTAFVFPNDATKVPNNLFNGCTAIRDVAFPEPDVDNNYYGITEIEYDAFLNCTALAEISLRNACKIGQTAFGNCNNLKSIYFGYDPTDANLMALVAGGRSIPDSAFYNNTKKTKGYVMRGYDDDFLMAYARKHNYSYETLNKIYTATKSDQPECKNATIKVTPEKILPGEKVTVTVTPSSGYSLMDFRVVRADNLGQIPSPVTLESFDRSKQVFSFEMPDDANYNLIIRPKVEKTADISVDNLEYFLDEADGTRNGPNSGSGFTLDAGKKYQIVLKNAMGDLPNWLWSYSSDKQDSVAVTSTGVLSTLTSTTNPAFVSVKMLNNAKGTVKFRVEVNDALTIKRVYVKGGENNAATWKGSKGIVIPAGKNQLDVTNRNTTDGDGNAALYPVVRIPKSLVAVGDYTFGVNINAYTDNAINPATDPRVVKSNWTSTDTTIAAPVAATSTTNSNTIRIVKGSQGEAAIGITTLNYGEKKVNGNNTEDTPAADVEYNETFVIVEVWDDTPRIAEKEIVINAQKKENLVTLFNAYADAGDNAAGKVYDDGMFNVYYDSDCTKPCKDFTVEYDKDKQRMNFVTTDDYDDRTPLNKTNTYKGLWLDVTLHERGKYIIPLPNVKVENKPLAPKLTSAGKLNLFYNTTATPDEKGNVKVTHNLTSETLVDVDLISTDNYKKYGKRAAEKVYTVVDGVKIRNATIEDKFYDNFNVAKADTRWIITRKAVAGTPHDIYTDGSKKAILSGYIYLYYKNYKYPVMQTYTVPSEITAPKYTITPASATGHTQVPDREYEVQLLDQLKEPVDISALLSDDGGTPASVWPDGLMIDGAKTKNTSIKTDGATLTKSIANDKITLGVNGTPKPGVAVIRIHMKTWSDYDGKTDDPKYLRYNFNLTVSSATPKVTANASRVYFNIAYSSVDAQSTTTGEKFEIQYNSSMPVDAPIFGFKNLTYTGVAKSKADAEKLIVKTGGSAGKFDFNDPTLKLTTDGKLTFELPNDFDATGSFNYKVTPVIKYNTATAQPIDLPAIAFTVSVTKADPTLKLSNATFTINYLGKIVRDGDDYGDTSYCETKYTLGGLSSGTGADDYNVDLTGADVDKVTTGAEDFANLAKQSVTQPLAGGVYKVTRVGGSRTAFSYKYRVKGATISTGTVTATLKDFDLTVKGVQTEPTITAKATGTMNFADSLSKITYDFTVKNVQGYVDTTNLKVFNVLPDGSESELNFEAIDGGARTNRVYVRIKEPKGIAPNTNYKLRFRFDLTAITPSTPGIKEYVMDVNVRPVQTFPKVTATYGSRNYIYAGEDTIDSGASEKADLDRKLTLYVTVPSASRLNYLVVSDENPDKKTNARGDYVLDNNNDNVMVKNGVRWAANTPDSYKRAFNISDVECLKDGQGKPTGVYKFNLTMKNAAAVPQNKDLTLNFVTYFKGQAINTNGVPISYKIQVRK